MSKDGRKLDPKKIKAIAQMPLPTNLTQLHAFLGMINYYGKFVKMHYLIPPLDELLRKNVNFVWPKQCQRAFEETKRILQSDLRLAHYDRTGIGAVILHRYSDGREKTICHTARALTASELNCSQIEKEALALTVKKFHRWQKNRIFDRSQATLSYLWSKTWNPCIYSKQIAALGNNAVRL